MNTLEIAEKMGKQHCHVIRDALKIAGADKSLYEESEYQSSRRRARLLILSEKLASDLFKQYDYRRVNPKTVKEACVKTIEQVTGKTLRRQHHVPPYFIDAYDPIGNVAYEIDGGSHRHKAAEDQARQDFISSAIGCAFVRIKLY